MKDMTIRQIEFGRDYLLTHNATQSARNVGYSPTNARRAGQKLLQNPRVKAFLDAERTKVRDAAGYDLEAALVELNQHLDGAVAAKQFTAAATLLKLKTELTGLYVQRLQAQVTTVDLTAALAEARSRAAIDGGRLEALPPAPQVIPKPAATVDIFED